MIKRNPDFDYYEQEETPPLEGPKIWHRPSDGAHFGRTDEGWMRYVPTHQRFVMRVGETIKVTVPKPPE
jgi:hypothetical protein